MQFGLFDIMQVLPDVPSGHAYAEHLRAVEVADQLGLDYYFVAERHFMPHYRTPAPSVWLGAVAASTSRIRLGALAYTVPLHNPARLAEEISMLDHLSGGRMEVGVGLGHRPEELAALGIDPNRRQLLMMEGIVLMQRAWRGQPFDHPGTAYRFQGLYVDPPVQRPHPPLWYAGNDPMAAQWCANNGLSLAVGFQPADQLLGPCAVYRATLKKQQEAKPSQRLALMRHLYIAENDAAAEEEMTRDVMAAGEAFAASPRQIAQVQKTRMTRGEARQAVARLKERQVVIGGGPETCARVIAETARTLMLDVFLANPWLTSVEPERVERTIRLFATEVAPRVKEMV